MTDRLVSGGARPAPQHVARHGPASQLSRQKNVIGTAPDGSPIFNRSMQEFRADPVPGRWTFVVVVTNPVAGTTTDQRFSGEVRFNTVDVRAAGVPNSPATVLPAGHPVTARVTVHNTGVVPENFFVDPRRTARTDQRLVTTDPETGVPVPPSPPVNYLVPTECNRVTTTATAPVPIDAELASTTGSPFVIGRSTGTRPAIASVPAAQVTPGPWTADASLVGPFPPGGVPPSKADFVTVGHRPTRNARHRAAVRRRLQQRHRRRRRTDHDPLHLHDRLTRAATPTLA
jgi:hypothetical protein